MMDKAPVYIVDIIGEAVAATDAALFADNASNAVKTAGRHINYLYGRGDQILTKLLGKDSSPTLKNFKYPLIALIQDFGEERGGTGYYAAVRLPSILICTSTNSTDDVPKRYNQTFKPILYPIYYELLNQLARNTNIVAPNGAEGIVHTKFDRPGIPPDPKSQFTDFLDIMELQGLSLVIKQQSLRRC